MLVKIQKHFIKNKKVQFYLSSFRVVSHSGPQTYMLLYFRSKEDSCSWVTRHTPCAHCRTWVYPYQGDASHHTTMDPASLSPPEPHAHGASPLDVNLRVVRFPAPRTPHAQTALVSRFDARNQRSPGALQEHNDAPAIHLQCVKGDTVVKAQGS